MTTWNANSPTRTRRFLTPEGVAEFNLSAVPRTHGVCLDLRDPRAIYSRNMPFEAFCHLVDEMVAFKEDYQNWLSFEEAN